MEINFLIPNGQMVRWHYGLTQVVIQVPYLQVQPTPMEIKFIQVQELDSLIVIL